MNETLTARLHHNNLFSPKIMSMFPEEHNQIMPEGYAPGDYDVICQRGKECFEHVGNKRFRKCIEQHLDSYIAAKNKQDKSAIVSFIVSHVRESAKYPRGGFVKKDLLRRCWYEVGDKLARDKVGQALRDAIKARKTNTARQSDIAKANKRAATTSSGASTATTNSNDTRIGRLSPRIDSNDHDAYHLYQQQQQAQAQHQQQQQQQQEESMMGNTSSANNRLVEAMANTSNDELSTLLGINNYQPQDPTTTPATDGVIQGLNYLGPSFAALNRIPTTNPPNTAKTAASSNSALFGSNTSNTTDQFSTGLPSLSHYYDSLKGLNSSSAAAAAPASTSTDTSNKYDNSSNRSTSNTDSLNRLQDNNSTTSSVTAAALPYPSSAFLNPALTGTNNSFLWLGAAESSSSQLLSSLQAGTERNYYNNTNNTNDINDATTNSIGNTNVFGIDTRPLIMNTRRGSMQGLSSSSTANSFFPDFLEPRPIESLLGTLRGQQGQQDQQLLLQQQLQHGTTANNRTSATLSRMVSNWDGSMMFSNNNSNEGKEANDNDQQEEQLRHGNRRSL